MSAKVAFGVCSAVWRAVAVRTQAVTSTRILASHLTSSAALNAPKKGPAQGKTGKAAPKKVVIGKNVKSATKKVKGGDTAKKAEIEEALAFIAPQQQRPKAKISAAEAERRVAVAKAYSRHCMLKDHVQMKQLCAIAKCRDNALAELLALSPALHAHALTVDPALYPINMKPITDTPPLHN